MAPPRDEVLVCRETGARLACAVAGAKISDPAAALELHTAACAKRPDECWSLVTYADDMLKRREPQRAQQALEKGCELKAPLACFRLATELEQGERGIAPDPAKAARTYDKTCELGVGRACTILAALVEDGRGAAKNASRAKQLRAKADGFDREPAKSSPDPAQADRDEQACRRARDPRKCAAAAHALSNIDAVKAEELHRIGCAADKTSCGLWTFALERLNQDDTSRGMRVLETGCREGSADACLVLAELLRYGHRVVPRSDPKAAEAYLRACELGEPHACRVSAARLRSGHGATKDVTKADELRERAAKLDEQLDKPRREGGEKWAREAVDQQTREPYVAELARRRSEWASLLEKFKSRLVSKAAPPVEGEEVEASAAREAAIRRMASSVLPPPAK